MNKKHPEAGMLQGGTEQRTAPEACFLSSILYGRNAIKWVDRSRPGVAERGKMIATLTSLFHQLH